MKLLGLFVLSILFISVILTDAVIEKQEYEDKVASQGKQANTYGNQLNFQMSIAGQMTGGCIWQIGEGRKGGTFSKVAAGNVPSGTQCMFLCVQKGASYNGAIMRNTNDCYCIEGMDGRDTDSTYISCFIR